MASWAAPSATALGMRTFPHISTVCPLTVTSLECSYGSQIKQSRRRNYLIHLEQKVQRLEHELRSARSTSLPDNTQRRASEPTIELSLATNSNPGVRDYNGTVPEISAPTICYWNNNAYKPFEQHGGSTEWVGPNTTKPFLSGLQIPNQCVQSSDGIYRHDSLSVSVRDCLCSELQADNATAPDASDCILSHVDTSHRRARLLAINTGQYLRTANPPYYATRRWSLVSTSLRSAPRSARLSRTLIFKWKHGTLSAILQLI